MVDGEPRNWLVGAAVGVEMGIAVDTRVWWVWWRRRRAVVAKGCSSAKGTTARVTTKLAGDSSNPALITPFIARADLQLDVGVLIFFGQKTQYIVFILGIYTDNGLNNAYFNRQPNQTLSQSHPFVARPNWHSSAQQRDRGCGDRSNLACGRVPSPNFP